jgi:hypothetical protein
MFVTQVFTRVNPVIDQARTAAALHATLAPKGVPVRDLSLDGIAQRVAEGLARGTPRERAWDPVSAEVKALGKTYRKVGSVITAAADLSAIDAPSLMSGVVHEVGIGVAQGPHPEIGDGALWIVLLLAERAEQVVP